MPPRILFLVNGLGLGNSTRCHAMMQRLRDMGASIEIITSGNGLWYFKDRPNLPEAHEMKSLYYASRQGRISIRDTILSTVDFMKILAHNTKVVDNVLDESRPDLVVTDSVYTFRPMKKRGISIAALNNSDVVHVAYRKFRDRPKSIRPQFWAIEETDYIFHRIIPDLVTSPTLDPTLPEAGGPFKRVGPIVRQGYDPAPVDHPPKRVLIMLSGSRFGTPVNLQQSGYDLHIDIVGRKAPEASKTPEGVQYHGKVLDNRELVKKADMVIVNGGFSAVSEIFNMRKPMVVVPVPNHAEQWVNARMIEHLNVGVMSREEDLEEAMATALERFDQFRAAYDRIPPCTDGAREAAEKLLQLIEK